MNKTELLTRFAPDDDARVTLGRLLDKSEAARTRNIPAATAFLSQGEQALAAQVLAAAGHPRHRFWGGYEGAERQVCLFLPDWMEDGDLPDDLLSAVETPLPAGSNLTHRDFLGSLMALGVTREVLGDILVGESRAQVVVLQKALPVLLTQWSEVGRYGAKPRAIPLGALEPAAPQVSQRLETFQSLRFDAVAAAAFGIPRSKAASLISGGKVELNHQPCEKPDRLLREGDVLTGRGLGKAVLRRVAGTSRKGRVMAELERYV